MTGLDKVGAGDRILPRPKDGFGCTRGSSDQIHVIWQRTEDDGEKVNRLVYEYLQTPTTVLEHRITQES